MGLTRRKFLETSVGTGAGITVSRWLKADAGVASTQDDQAVPAPTGEWMANTPASAYRAYRSKPAKTADTTTWVQIDLGEARPIDLRQGLPGQ